MVNIIVKSDEPTNYSFVVNDWPEKKKKKGWVGFRYPAPFSLSWTFDPITFVPLYLHHNQSDL